jgi:CO2 hydration protein
LASYAVVIDAYSHNLLYIAQEQFLELFPFFKYFNGEVNRTRLFKHLWHDRLNFEYAEYCMRAMLWHGGGGLDAYLDSPEFVTLARKAIAAKTGSSAWGWMLRPLDRLSPEFLLEQVRQQAYYSGLGQFWRVMADIFFTLETAYDQGQIKTVSDIVDHIRNGLVAEAARPIVYSINHKGQSYDILPASAGLTFLMDTAVPYVEAVFFRGTPFLGTVSYNAQFRQIPYDQGEFAYGALYADPLPIGGAGIPPTLVMQDMRHFLPQYYWDQVVPRSKRGGRDLRVILCESFQRSMFCVTTAALQGLAPHPFSTDIPAEQQANRTYLESWMNRLVTSRVNTANQAWAITG